MSLPLIVISDATPLIALAKIRQLTLLPQLFSTVLLAEAVYAEMTLHGSVGRGAVEIASAPWIQQVRVVDRARVSIRETQLDRGEAESIVLAQEQQIEEKKTLFCIMNECFCNVPQ